MQRANAQLNDKLVGAELVPRCREIKAIVREATDAWGEPGAHAMIVFLNAVVHDLERHGLDETEQRAA